MAIDSVGGTRDPNEASRQRAMQEERARDVKAAQERRESEINTLNNQRETEIQSLHETLDRDLEGRKLETIERMEQAKSLSENRLRSFQNETEKMAEEAKRQYSAKAVALQKSSQELQTQREALVRQHEETMRQLHDKGQTTEAELGQRLLREAGNAHIQATQKLEEVADRGRAEVDRLHTEILDQKRHTTTEGDIQIQNLKSDYADNARLINNEIAFDKRIGEEQLVRERENLSRARQGEEIKADQALTRLKVDTQQKLGRTHTDGHRKIIEAEDTYGRQLGEVGRDSRKKVRDLQIKTELSMASISHEAEGQEAVARQAYANQKAALSQARTKNIDDGIKANSDLEQKLAAEYEVRGKHLVAAKEDTLRKIIDRDTGELQFRMDEDKRKINNATQAGARTIASHNARADDPFYQLHSVHAQVEDGEQFTVVRINVPEHEQDSVRITLQRGQLAVSGTRRSEAHAVSEDGHKSISSNYQSFSETFPVKGKLMMNNMLRAYADGELVFRIPKG